MKFIYFMRGNTVWRDLEFPVNKVLMYSYYEIQWLIFLYLIQIKLIGESLLIQYILANFRKSGI